MRVATVLILVLVFHLQLLFNSSFTVWPEIILYPYLMNNGFLLYKDIITPYFPLLPEVLSKYFMLFGATVINLKIFTYITILISDLVIFLFAYKISKSKLKGILAVLTFVFLNISFGGNGLWFELALTPLIIFSLFILYMYKNKPPHIFFAGLALGTAVIVKQNAALFYLPVLLLLASRRNFANIKIFLIPNVILLIILLVYLTKLNLTYDFFNWAIHLPLSYPKQSSFVLLPTIKQYSLMVFLIIPCILVVFKNNSKLLEKLFWLVSFLFAANFAFPRYENFHLQILVGLSSIFAVSMPKKYFLVFVFIAILLFLKTENRLWGAHDRFLDQETYVLSDLIKGFDSVYLLNSPDLAYFLAGKLPPKLWAANFPWYFEQPGFAERFINNLKIQRIHYIVVREGLGGGRYSLGNYFPEKVLDYIGSNYLLKKKIGRYQVWQAGKL